MFLLYANKTQLTVRRREPTTSGSVNVYPVCFEFSADWEGLTRTAVFKADGVSRSVLPDESGECTIPWEVLEKPMVRLMAGVYGTRGGEVVLPTIWADMGVIQPGVAPGREAQPPAPDLWRQELGTKGDRLAYDGLNLSLMSGDRVLSTVQVAGGGVSGGNVAADEEVNEMLNEVFGPPTGPADPPGTP